MEGNALKPGMGLNPDAELARNITPVRDQLDQIITKTAPEYGQALGIGAGLRETQLEPLKVGPIGDISKTTDVGQQAAAIFPSEPRADFHTVAAQSVRRLSAKNPQAAEALAYDYLKTSLDQAATRFKTTGEDTNAGAGFAARVAGTPETMKVLQGVMKALPSGQQRWEGLNKILEVFQAQQYRPTAQSADRARAEYAARFAARASSGRVCDRGFQAGDDHSLPTARGGTGFLVWAQYGSDRAHDDRSERDPAFARACQASGHEQPRPSPGPAAGQYGGPNRAARPLVVDVNKPR